MGGAKLLLNLRLSRYFSWLREDIFLKAQRGLFMIKKGLIALVCLTVMSALWSWATTTYSISTAITSLGTVAVTDSQGNLRYDPVVGGSIRVRQNAPQTLGIKYTNFTTAKAVNVWVTPVRGYKIANLKINGTDQPFANQTTAYRVTFRKPTPIATQKLVASFAVASPGEVTRKIWQLQTQNVNDGGAIVTTRGSEAPTTLTAYGKLVLKNYLDTTPVTVAVTTREGYQIKSITHNGATVTSPFTITPTTTGSSVNTVRVTYNRTAFTVQTHTQDNLRFGLPYYPPNGIAPINPRAVYGGSVRLIVTPTASNNIVNSIAITGNADIAFTDRFGVPTRLPFRGPIKVTISNIKSNIVVTTGFLRDNTEEMQNCTSTCHLNARPAVQEVAFQWYSSTHKRTAAVDCVTCHSYMPGKVNKRTVDSHTFQILSSVNGSSIDTGKNYCATCHKSGSGATATDYLLTHTGFSTTCASCHISLHNPDKIGNLPSACTSCHGTIATNFATSLHSTRTGKATFYNDGMDQLSTLPMQQGFGNFVNVAFAALPCAGCHNAAATTVGGVDTWTGASCADCHNITNPTQAVPMQTCLGCHSRQAYEGMAGSGFGLTDVHLNGGMMNGKPFTCTTCHSTTDMHGDGTAKASMLDPGAITANCQNCHTVASLSAVPEHTQHLSKIDCSTCHMQSAVTCYNCHFDNEGLPLADTSVTHQKFASAKFGGQGVNSWRFLVNRVMPNGSTKVFPGSMQSLMADKTANNDGTDNGLGTTFVSIAPYYSHSITKVAALRCDACHGTTTAINIANGVAVDVVKWNPAAGVAVAFGQDLKDAWTGPSGVIPVPEAAKSLLNFDFVDLVTPNAPWVPAFMNVSSARVLFKRGADNIHMMDDYVKPLTAQQIQFLKIPHTRPIGN